MQGLNEKDLISSFNKGDEVAFSSVYKSCYADVYYIARRFIDNDRAKDVTAEIFVNLWRGKKEFATLQNLKAWLSVVTRNACIDILRKNRTETSRLQLLASLSAGEYEKVFFEDILETDVLKNILLEIEKMPPHIRTVFKLAWFEGLKNKEIGEKLQIKDSTVRNRKAEALQMLRSRLLHADFVLLSVLLASAISDG